jgi:probable F420-dependent oxidoreductase
MWEGFVKLGVVFPQTEIGSDPTAIRDYAQAVEGAGFDYLIAYDHVLGAHPDRFAGRRMPYTYEHQFHEPFVLFGYLASITRRLELVTAILILPQRQTALVAKQAAAVDVLSGGRLRLGVGIGWNFTEYEALGADFHTRGRRVTEQIAVLRRLWTEPLVTFQGKWHRLDRVGIAPRPVQQPIPVWMGGMAEPALKRLAKVADGWFPQFRPGTDEARAMVERLHGYIRAAGRDPAAVGIDGRVSATAGGPEEWRQHAQEWRALGATHLAVNTMGQGFTSPHEHIEAVLRWKRAMDEG